MRSVALLASLAGGVLLAASYMLDSLVDRVLFQPTRGVDVRPASLGIVARERWLRSEDGVRLHSFLIPGGGSPASRAILFLHGNAGNASHRLPNAAALARLGADVLLLDYRGYGLSEGRPSREGVVADARAALDFLTREHRVPRERIVLFGRSLGGAVAVALASQQEPLGGVILESTFTSLPDLARTVAGPLGRALVRDGFDSIGRIPSVRSPLLFFHGDRDEVVPFELGRRLFEAAPEPKAFEVIAGARHNDTVEVGGAAYMTRLAAFLAEVTP